MTGRRVRFTSGLCSLAFVVMCIALLAGTSAFLPDEPAVAAVAAIVTEILQPSSTPAESAPSSLPPEAVPAGMAVVTVEPLDEFAGCGEGDKDGFIGSIDGDRYVHPLGFSMTIPDGWSLAEMPDGAAVFSSYDDIRGQGTIWVTFLEADEGSLAGMTRSQLDGELRRALAGYSAISMDYFFLGEHPCWEHAYSYLTQDGGQVVEQVLYFEPYDTELRRGIIGVRAPAAYSQEYLRVYDLFVRSFAPPA